MAHHEQRRPGDQGGDHAGAAHDLAKTLRIDYLYVDRTERSAYPAVSKFDEHPEYFPVAFKNAEADALMPLLPGVGG